jgi:hypothetical protein
MQLAWTLRKSAKAPVETTLNLAETATRYLSNKTIANTPN